MHTHNFKIFQTINTFGRDIYNGKITLKEGDKDQSSLLVEIMDFKKKTKPKTPEKKQQKKDVLDNLYALFEGRKRVLGAFENIIFTIKIEGIGFLDKVSHHSNLKILTPKQMLQNLPIAFTSKNR